MENNLSGAAKLKELISGIHVAMLTTLKEDGALHSRPMWTQQFEMDGALWFFTGADSAKGHELQQDGHVCLNYAAEGSNTYVSVYGRGQLVRDRAKAEKLWSPLYKAWFPQGLDDPNLSLLKITVERAEYWDAPSSKIVQLLGFAKALTTGKPYEPSENEHGKVDLTG